MKPSDDIFLLIKSMSAKERNFFRKKYNLITEDTDGNYLKLFQRMSRDAENGKSYDETAILSEDYSGKFVKNFPVHKNYLYNLVLDFISMSNADSKAIFTIRQLITKAELLSDRLLYDQSLKFLLKAKKLAYDIEKYSYLYEIINTEKNIIRHMLSVEELEKKNEELFNEQSDAVSSMQNLTEYYKLNELVGIFLRRFGSGKVRGKDMMREFDTIFGTPLLKDVSMAKSFTATYIFHNLNLQYHLTNENYREAYRHAKAAVELFETDNAKSRVRSENHIYSLSNLLNCQIRMKEFGEFETTAVKMDKMLNEEISMPARVFIFYTLSVLRLSKNMECNNIAALEKLEIDIRHELPAYEEGITLYQRIILFYFLSCSNFFQGVFENCLHWNSKILNLGKTDLSEDYQCYARLIQLISFLELGYLDSVEYALKSVYHFISRKQKIYKYETVIQKYLRRSFRIKTDKELKEMFVEMKDEVLKLQKDSFEKNALDAFNILPWLESKIRNIPISKAVNYVSR